MNKNPDLQWVLQTDPDPNQMTSILQEFTQTYRSFGKEDIEMREAACIRVQIKGRVRPVEEDDLFAGRMMQMPIGFIPQSKGTGMGYCIHPDIDSQLLIKPDLTSESRNILKELLEFWQKEGTVYKSRRKMPDEVTRVVPSELYYLESGIAFVLYRMSGIQLNYSKLLALGIPGLRAEVSKYKSTVQEGSKAFRLYVAMEHVLETFSELAAFYAVQVLEQARQTRDENRKVELENMSQVLTNIAHKRPATFREGLQLIYLYNIFDGTKNYGRMDDSLADLYHSDLKSGTIDDEEGIRLLISIWQLMKSRDNRYDTRLIIGGRGRNNEEKANRVAMLILETTRRVKESVPQVALRFHNDQDPSLYQKGLDLLATGNTYPMLYNDEVNIPSARKAFLVPHEEAEHIIQYGCGEYVLNHRSVGTPSGVINLLQALLVTMNRGIDPATGKYQGMPVESYLKYNNFNTFEDLVEAYKEQVEYHVGPLALQEYLEYKHAADDNAYLLSSLLMDDCLARGKAIFDGGIRYLGGTLETYGNTNTADSLVAIKELVYHRKIFTLDVLNQMLKANFQGYGKELKMIINCPKYGNDHQFADRMYGFVHDHICSTTRDQAKEVGLDSYLVVVINNDANTVMGSFTAASPDGRKAFSHLNPGNNPVGGADKNGVTACLNSLVKADTTLHAGAVQNMKFSKEMLSKYRRQFESLLQTYFEKGGSQIMLTVVSRGELEDAQKHPENYQNLIVRVGGFSERFVNLPPETQNEVLSRTLN